LDVLNCFDGLTPLSQREISARVHLPESSLFRVLRTLEQDQYLRQSPDGTYQLSPQLIFGWLVRAADHVRKIARPELERLVRVFNETATLAYLFDDRIHVVDCIETFHEIRMTSKIGRTMPPHCSALGKAISAFQDRGLAERLLEAYGLTPRNEQAVTDRRKLFAELEQVRECGIACDREEFVRGGICFAAAICPSAKPVMSAIGLSMPTVRMDTRRELEIQEALLGAAQAIAYGLQRFRSHHTLEPDSLKSSHPKSLCFRADEGRSIGAAL
jgi:DNA-binding IclR family transcriptional regulator